MNEHILTVMLWVKDDSFYTDKEIIRNHESSYEAACDAIHGAVYLACDSVVDYVVDRQYSNQDKLEVYCTEASSWVNKYFSLSGDNRTRYENEVKKRISNKTR